MGLPESLVDRFGVDVLRRHTDLLTCNEYELIETLESENVEADRRFASGTFLAILGDPRINPYKPKMITSSGGTATLGLPYERVKAVAACWRHVGVEEEWISKECPQYEVDVKSFAIGRFPVTNLEYRLFLEDTGSVWLPSSWLLGTYPACFSNHPVWTVPPEAASAYALWLARRTNRCFRLPSEAEWEFTASNGDGREYPWGDTFDTSRANTVEAGPLSTTPVGMYRAGQTPTGLDDLAGNVEEYTSENYRPYAGGSWVEDDIQRAEGSYRIARGGSFSRYGDLARCRRRHGWYRGPIYAMGFRLAETL
jgi:formylglycine-generating enzyme required for sulfatase activity